MKGFNFSDWGWTIMPRPTMYGPLYYPPQADVALKSLAATGTNWISLLVNIYQETISSTEITRAQHATASDQALRHMIDLAHNLGMRAALNPNLMLSADPTHDHIEIGNTFTTEEQWQAWFASYRQIIIHYATLAQNAGADMFFIGQELVGTIHREADWRRVAQEVRQVYKGPIIYEAVVWDNPSFSEELRITWWDAVDYIGVLGYFSLTQSNNPTVEELKSAWVERGYLSRLGNLSQKFQKPIIMSEIGYQSADGTNTEPGNFNKFAQAPVDLEEQADCYQAAFEVLWGKPWLKGIFWWQWNAISTKWLEDPQGKPAEEVLKKFYLAEEKP